ncbi:MAG: catalase [Archangiaceae bacterium]|nr:catalase [Archangiaceae bacterium]
MHPARSARFVLLCLVSCGPHLTEAQRHDALEASLKAIDPNAEPAPPRPPPEDGVPAFNTEYWLGDSEEVEQARVREFGKQIRALQEQVAGDRHQPPLRGFHAKSHGCLHGELQPRADRDPRTKYGLFAEGAGPLPIWVRFSNGVGWKQADAELDARGMAVKVMNVPGTKYLDDEQSTQDFLMTNSPVPVGKDAEEFMQFAHANVKGRAAGIFFLLGHLKTGSALTKTGAIDSAVTTTYFSGGPAHLGAHQAVKFLARPCDGTAKREPPQDDPNYLKYDLVNAAKEPVCFTFYVQLQVDPIETPIENASVAWDEKLSVPLPVADLRLPAQELAPNDFCDGLAFTPWHSIAAHKPMGNHNRARRTVYAASQKERGHDPEPTPWQAPEGK